MRIQPSLLLAFLVGATHLPAQTDWRDLQHGFRTPSENYADQPYFVVLEDGKWLLTLTTGPGVEGSNGQHVVSTTSTDNGRTWTPLVDIELTGASLPAPDTNILSSWVVPYQSESIANWRHATGVSGPAVVAGIAPSRTIGVPGQSVTFDATHSYITELTTPVYTWDFGDGSPAVQGAVVNHGFAAKGTYQVTLTISEAGTPKLQGHPVATLGFEVH